MTAGDGSRRGTAERCRVLLSNLQRRVRVSPEKLRRAALRVLRAARPEGGELSVLLVDDPTIARLNADYRGRPRPTDVLSFSQLEGPPARRSNVAPSRRNGPPRLSAGSAVPSRGAGVRGLCEPARRSNVAPSRRNGPPRLIGDVVISVETARRQARERGRPLDEEIGALLVHGVLHLLGHDHERSAAAARRMFARERQVAAAAGLTALALGDRPRHPDALARARSRARARRRGEA